MTQRPRWGATPEEWNWAAYHAGRDLLPAVGNPDPSIPRTGKISHLESLAKTPSRIGSNGVAYGIRGWVAHQATPELVAEWTADPDLNCLLITRHIRALDIDIANQALADSIEQYVVASLGVQPVVRYRADSGKRTLLFRMNRPQRKRVIRIGEWGALEFLADGQQTALFGTHPSGERFQLRGYEAGFPEIDPDRMAHLWDAMRAAYEPTNTKPFHDPDEASGEFIVRNGGALASDPVLRFLESEGLVVGYESNGTANVRCPNEAQHTSHGNPNATVWMPAGLGGKEHGGFRCLHAHCEHIKTLDFIKLIGFDNHRAQESFKPTAQPSPVAAIQQPAVAETQQGSIDTIFVAPVQHPVAVVQSHELIAAQLEQSGIGFVFDAKGKPTQTFANLQHVCRGRPDFIKVKFDEFTETLMVQLGGEEVWRAVDDDVISTVREGIERQFNLRFSASDISAALSAAGKTHKYDSAQQWVRSLQWDGVDRITGFARDVLKAPDSEYGRAVSHYLWAAMVARVMEPGVKADMTPVLISPKQGTGKSSLVESLVPFAEWYGELDLSSRDDDTARLLRGKVVLELPELKGLASRDAESIKAWMTKRVENWTPKYKEYAVKYPRRCLFVGTDNRHRFLTDPTGNRRWLPLRVAITAHFVDWPAVREQITQYWAQAWHMLQKFPDLARAVDSFAKTADALAEPARLAATQLDEYFEEVRNFLAQQLPGHRVTIRAIRSHLAFNEPYAERRVHNVLRMLGYEQLDGSVQWYKPDRFIL